MKNFFFTFLLSSIVGICQPHILLAQDYESILLEYNLKHFLEIKLDSSELLVFYTEEIPPSLNKEPRFNYFYSDDSLKVKTFTSKHFTVSKKMTDETVKELSNLLEQNKIKNYYHVEECKTKISREGHIMIIRKGQQSFYFIYRGCNFDFDSDIGMYLFELLVII